MNSVYVVAELHKRLAGNIVFREGEIASKAVNYGIIDDDDVRYIKNQMDELKPHLNNVDYTVDPDIREMVVMFLEHAISSTVLKYKTSHFGEVYTDLIFVYEDVLNDFDVYHIEVPRLVRELTDDTVLRYCRLYPNRRSLYREAQKSFPHLHDDLAYIRLGGEK